MGGKLLLESLQLYNNNWQPFRLVTASAFAYPFELVAHCRRMRWIFWSLITYRLKRRVKYENIFLGLKFNLFFSYLAKKRKCEWIYDQKGYFLISFCALFFLFMSWHCGVARLLWVLLQVTGGSRFVYTQGKGDMDFFHLNWWDFWKRLVWWDLHIPLVFVILIVR